MVRYVGQDPTWQRGVLREGRLAGAPRKVVALGVPGRVLSGAGLNGVRGTDRGMEPGPDPAQQRGTLRWGTPGTAPAPRSRTSPLREIGCDLN